MNKLNVTYQKHLFVPEHETVFINGQEAGEIELKPQGYEATALCGKRTIKQTKAEALDFITQFLKGHSGHAINQTKLF